MQQIENILTLKSKWVDIYCDKWKDGTQILDYWRVEKLDSIIILPIFENEFILPKKQYRVGIDAFTLDFPGGRRSHTNLADSAKEILIRELEISEKNINGIVALGNKKFIVNSSFNSQCVSYYVAYLKDIVNLKDCIRYSIDDNALQDDLECLQCAFGLLLYKGQKYE